MKAYSESYAIPVATENPPIWSYLQVDEIERLLRVLELKRWWVAESIGVHRTTFRRWLRGRISKVRSYRAAALARVLEVRLDDISVDGKWPMA